MVKVKFVKWHSSVVLPAPYAYLRWGEIELFEHDADWLHVVNFLILLGFYVGIHWDANTNIISIVVDTTFFTRR